MALFGRTELCAWRKASSSGTFVEIELHVSVIFNLLQDSAVRVKQLVYWDELMMLPYGRILRASS